jgi:small subunit ribosomal protein S7
VAPLVKVRQMKGVAGGGKTLPVPVPMGVKMRRRTAIKWILDSADKRNEVRLTDRVSREIINVAEGTSSTWEKRLIVHKVAVSSRINVKVMLATPRRR